MDHEESVKPATQQETTKALGTNTSEMDIYKFHDKEFKTIILRKRSEVQENKSSSTKSEEKMHELNENFNKKESKSNRNSPTEEYNEW